MLRTPLRYKFIWKMLWLCSHGWFYIILEFYSKHFNIINSILWKYQNPHYHHFMNILLLTFLKIPSIVLCFLLSFSFFATWAAAIMRSCCENIWIPILSFSEGGKLTFVYFTELLEVFHFKEVIRVLWEE